VFRDLEMRRTRSNVRTGNVIELCLAEARAPYLLHGPICQCWKVSVRKTRHVSVRSE
jgi:hypothetical protein